MASILRQIVAGPRLRHPEAGLDLCYVTDNIIATSGPSTNYPQRAYRTPLDDLVSFLDAKHGKDWAIWEFRAEGTGYPDEEVYGRIHHYPWPDHHPPPFALIPPMMGSMRNWLQGIEPQDKPQSPPGERVMVVHCKAGKGRSGTAVCSYLISQEGWKIEDALQRFTERRMRARFGAGVSIPSQLRWVRYVDRWTNQMGKKYVERPVEILELHVWGLRDGVKAAVEGFEDKGKKIKCFHLFHHSERTDVDSGQSTPQESSSSGEDSNSPKEPLSAITNTQTPSNSLPPRSTTEGEIPTSESSDDTNPKHLSAYIFRPSERVILPTSDVNIVFERRSKASYKGWAMVTSVAHVWFNAFFEGGDKHDSGVFEAEWDALDGIKGTTKKGVRSLERLQVVWRYPSASELEAGKSSAVQEAPAQGQAIPVPQPGEPIQEDQPADWHLRETHKENEPRVIPHNQENQPPAAQDVSQSGDSPALGQFKRDERVDVNNKEPARENAPQEEVTQSSDQGKESQKVGSSVDQAQAGAQPQPADKPAGDKNQQ
ncbi:phosphatases II [Aspergillus campestris IBT 28561]|uniref:phosphatidylinositol-3,4,5-trisphosphate 3-phosphatase n=1 Tax=Aspergillus campestris (strain IBT 28561) TaxID=1392248 RepID=A0A2I1CUV4_ASPC2|nr:phosphatases II [Aspergillus campestris IBT 28561]PKY01397.1 phosphatases II [Aspergillus campestris IBT 28561]